MSDRAGYSKLSQVIAFSLITVWMPPCWGATYTVTLPDDQDQAIVQAVCNRWIKWPVWANDAACAQGHDAVIRAIFESVSAYLRNYSKSDVDATLEITP